MVLAVSSSGGRRLIVIGNETTGLAAAWHTACDLIIAIPIQGSASSLNAAAAATVILYEAHRQHRNTRTVETTDLRHCWIGLSAAAGNLGSMTNAPCRRVYLCGEFAQPVDRYLEPEGPSWSHDMDAQADKVYCDYYDCGPPIVIAVAFGTASSWDHTPVMQVVGAASVRESSAWKSCCNRAPEWHASC